MKIGYYENLNEIVDELNQDGKEVKVVKLPPQKGPKKMIMFKKNWRY